MDQPEAPEHAVGLEEVQTSQADAEPNATSPTAAPDAVADQLLSSPSPPPISDDTAVQPFGAALAPVLLEVCECRLTNLNWFRTDWQRGGALTGYADWVDDTGQTKQAVVKMPVPPVEQRWLVQLAGHGVTPDVYAHGDALGGYDLAWVVMERLAYGPLNSKWGAASFELLADAAARFYAEARRVPLIEPKPPREWEAQLKLARDHIGRDVITDSQRWRKVLKQVGKKLPKWLDTWHARDRGTWCHGDLHMGNAMLRNAPPTDETQAAGPALLFDLASVQPGHWVEDAVYLEHLYWANPAGLCNTKPVNLIAKRMRDRGLTPGDHWPELANIYRALLAMVAPAYRNKLGGNAQAAASLEVLERLL